MAGDSMWYVLKPSNIDSRFIRPGALIPCDPADVRIIRIDEPPWESARALLEDGDHP